jgi:hypothetical protein
MPIGGGKEYVMVNMAMTASNDEGNPILNNMGGRCQLSRIIDPSAKTVESHGFCTYVDSADDQIFEQCDLRAWRSQQVQTHGWYRQVRGSSS